MSDDKLKKRMLTELKPVLLADILAMRVSNRFRIFR